jgi:hypothetical protein
MKHRVIRVLAAFSLLSGLQPALAQDEDKPIVVIDLRPDEEKEGHGLSPLTGKCNDDVFRIADVATDPLKIDVLKGDLEPLMGTAGKTLTVLNWSIYYNKQVQKGGGKLSNIGIQGYSVPTKDEKKRAGSKCSKKESAGGWYEAKEITSVYFPIISEFTGTFAGKPVNVRVVYSPRSKLPGKFEGEAADSEALLEAVHQTSEAVATAILQ